MRLLWINYVAQVGWRCLSDTYQHLCSLADMGRSCAAQPTLLFSSYTSHLLCHLQSWLASFCLSHILLENLCSLLPVQTTRARRMKHVLETIFPAVLHQNIHRTPNRAVHKIPSISLLQNHKNFLRKAQSWCSEPWQANNRLTFLCHFFQTARVHDPVVTSTVQPQQVMLFFEEQAEIPTGLLWILGCTQALPC